MLPVLVLLVMVLTPGAECLMCYQCADTQMEGPCQTETADLMESSMTWNSTDDTSPYLEYTKLCPTEQKYCVIERIEDKGVMFAYIRDCSDGVTMSVNDVERFQNISFNKNNYTSCGFRFQIGLVCITLCEGDFCNGPNINAVNGAGRPGDSLFLLIITSCWTIYHQLKL